MYVCPLLAGVGPLLRAAGAALRPGPLAYISYANTNTSLSLYIHIYIYICIYVYTYLSLSLYIYIYTRMICYNTIYYTILECNHDNHDIVIVM